MEIIQENSSLLVLEHKYDAMDFQTKFYLFGSIVLLLALVINVNTFGPDGYLFTLLAILLVAFFSYQYLLWDLKFNASLDKKKKTIEIRKEKRMDVGNNFFSINFKDVESIEGREFFGKGGRKLVSISLNTKSGKIPFPYYYLSNQELSFNTKDQVFAEKKLIYNMGSLIGAPAYWYTPKSAIRAMYNPPKDEDANRELIKL